MVTLPLAFGPILQNFSRSDTIAEAGIQTSVRSLLFEGRLVTSPAIELLVN